MEIWLTVFSLVNFWYSSSGHSKGVCGMRSVVQWHSQACGACRLRPLWLFSSSECVTCQLLGNSMASLVSGLLHRPDTASGRPGSPRHLHTGARRTNGPGENAARRCRWLCAHRDQHPALCASVPLKSFMLLRSYAFWLEKKKRIMALMILDEQVDKLAFCISF